MPLPQHGGSMERYAIFFVPRHHTALAAFGRSWFARDPEPDRADPLHDAPEPETVLPDHLDRASLTTVPRRYGLHLTLKAPFPLKEGASIEALHQAARAFATRRSAALMPQLRLGICADCFALMPQTHPADVLDLAAACVEAFDAFRRPATSEETAMRRRKDRLTEKQDELLLRWGFPFVFDEARIALTLTAPVTAVEQKASAAIGPLVEPLCRVPLLIEDICIVRQRHALDDFKVTHRIPLSARAG